MSDSDDFLRLKTFMCSFDWLPVKEILGKRFVSRRGRKKDFERVNLFKVFVLKSYLSIDDNTIIVKRLSESKVYLEFCGLRKIPSHDTLSRFEKAFSHKFIDIFEFLDDTLEASGVFENDDISFDGTDIPVPFKNKQSAHRYHFGAKSNKKKFHGFWLMIAASIKYQVPRKYVLGYAREGQINLAKRMFTEKQIDNSKRNIFIIMDGIFDFTEMHEIVISTQQKIPIIGYNQRRSGIPERANLPSTDWHFKINPVYKNDKYIQQEFKRRTSIERVNSYSKIYTPMCLIQNKIRKSQTIKKTTVENIIVFAFIVEQITLLAKIQAKKAQSTINDFTN
jgi:hypothetical protein